MTAVDSWPHTHTIFKSAFETQAMANANPRKKRLKKKRAVRQARHTTKAETNFNNAKADDTETKTSTCEDRRHGRTKRNETGHDMTWHGIAQQDKTQ